jgi:HlyD family secretion protein
MTAAATIVSTERTGVLLVPNTALRFTPTSESAAAASAPVADSGGVVSKLVPRMPRTGGRKAAGGNGVAAKQVWVLKDGQAVVVAVKPGISDGRMTEVSGEGLQEGAAVITDQRAAGAAQ